MKRTLFNAYMNHLLQSYSIFDGVLQVFILLYHHCEYIMYTYFLLTQFFISSKLKDIFNNISLVAFPTFTIFNCRYLTWNKEVDNFKASMLSSTSFVCLTLAVSYVLLHCCPLLNSIFFYSLLQVSAQNLFAYNFYR